MNADQDSTKALRARRKAEQVGMYADGQEHHEEPRPPRQNQSYIDAYSSSSELPKGKSYLDATERTGENTAPNEILEYLDAIRNRKLVVMLTALVGAIWGVVSLIPEAPIYISSTTVELQGFNESFMNMNQVDPQAGTGNYSPNALNLTTQLRIIESSSMRSTVLDMLQRETTPVMKPQVGFMAKLRNRYGKSAAQDPLEYTREALGWAAGTMYARSLTGTRIIEIAAESTSPDIAALFVNTVANEYIAQNSQQRTGSSQKTVQFLDSQVEETKVKLAEAEEKLQQFQRKSGAVFAPDQDTLAGSRLKQLKMSLAAIQADRIAKQSKYEQVKTTSPDALPDVLADTSLREIQSKLTGLKQKRAEWLTTMTPAMPKVAKLEGEITFLENQLKQERDNVIERIKTEYETARRQENNLMSAFSGQTGAVLSQEDKNVEYKLLNREAETLRMQLNAFLQQANQASAASALPTNNVRVIDPAKPPSLPYKPNSLQRVSSNMMLGAAFGCLIAMARGKYLKSRTARKFAAPGHSSLLLQVPELGVIPSASFRSPKKDRWNLPWKRNGSRTLPGGMTEALGSGNLELIGPQEGPSLLADSFRLMVVSITLMNKDPYSNAFLITSPGPAEGKTTLISNLAVVMAETGRRVLLIDMDLRKPRLHHLFGVDPKRGFTDLILSDAPMDRLTVEEFIQPTKFAGVSILPCGQMLDIKSINQLFYSPRVAAFLKIVRKMVDIVLIDAPPMMQFSEARLMASMADRVILVLRSGSTDRETALACQQRLAEDGANLLGTILNDWDPSASQVDYTGYYSYYHHQAEDK